MGRSVLHWVCVFALVALPIGGCSDESTAAGGSGGSAGTGGTKLCEEDVDCDDGDECTVDSCIGDTCSSKLACDDGNDCTEAECDPSNGECVAPTLVADGTTCAGGTCQAAVCELTGSVLPCTQQGILNAIAAGGGPYTFSCDGPTTVVTTGTIDIDNDVILNGEGNLTLDGDDDHPVLVCASRDVPVTAELRGFRVTGAADFGIMQVLPAIYIFDATLTLTDSTVSDNEGDGIYNQGGTLTLLNTTVSGNGFINVINENTFDEPPLVGTLTVTNSTISGGRLGIRNYKGQATILNSTVSGNTMAGIQNGAGATLTLTNSTVSGNSSDDGGDIEASEGTTVTLVNTIVEGVCIRDVASDITSDGFNIESPGDTCGFDQVGDQVDVSAIELDLQPLADNGGPTQTHAITTDSAAFNAGTCEVTTDQRGVTRPQGAMCDVGAFEVQP